MLCDTGPLVALIDEDDPNWARCTKALESLSAQPFVTTWPCMTEAMYLLGRAAGFTAQERLWGLVEDGFLTIHRTDELERVRMRALMRQYQDSPMDFADASLVAAAEALGLRWIFTLDSHFRAYRIGDRETFEIIP